MATDTEQPKRTRGRPGIYASDAERAKAWRQRQRELIAAAQVSVEPVIVEKLVEVEKFVERIVEKVVQAPVTLPRQAASAPPNASKLFPLLKERFNGYQGEETAKRFRTNAAKAATASREILSLAQRGGAVPQVEEDFLRNAAQFFDHLNGIFHNVQLGAKRAAAKAENERKAKHAAAIKDMVFKTFGPSPALADVLAMGELLLAFDKEANAWLVNKYSVGKGYIYIPREYELKNAIQQRDLVRMVREIAETRLEIGERGRRWVDGEQNGWAAGWQDFEDYRTNEIKL